MKQYVKILAPLWCLLFMGISSQMLQAQDREAERLEQVRVMLDSLALTIPKLNDSTTISMRDVTLAEYVRAIGKEHSINVYIRETPSLLVTTTLTNEPIKSVFLFICKNFSYRLEATGSIIEFYPYIPPRVEPEPEVTPPKPLKITYEDGLLSLDLTNDSLFRVMKRISELTNRKIITRPGTDGLLTAFLPPTNLDTALEALFVANGMKITSRKKGYYIIESLRNGNPVATDPANPRIPANNPGGNNFYIETYQDGEEEYITIEASDANLEELIRAIFEAVESDFLFYDDLAGRITIDAEITRLEDAMKYILQGTDYTYKRDGNLYLIGPKDLDGLSTTRIVRMKYRPTFQAIDLIPGTGNQTTSTNNSPSRNNNVNNNNIRNNNLNNNRFNNQTNPNYPNGYYDQGYGNAYGGYGNYGGGYGNYYATNSDPPEIIKTQVGDVEIVEYPELNRIILKGPSDKVDQVAEFLAEIDQPVPMVKIEMIVIELSKDRLVSTGISAGRRAPGDSLRVAKGILPGVDYTLDGSELNAIFSNVPVLSNLGTLRSDFYVQLRALESRGNLKIQMEPVLSMLNGREASLTIGQTQYYLLETQTASTGAVNNFQQFTQRFERIEANIHLSLRPYISEDEIVTLDVIPDFTTPVGSFDADVPPTIATRRFVSTIRVKNGETVILGGLTQSEKRENTRGLPVLSRIPVLKWFFSNVDKANTQSSLLIYITPRIFYF